METYTQVCRDARKDFDMASRYERRQAMAQALVNAGITEIEGRTLEVPTREPEHVLKNIHGTVFPKVAKPTKKIPHVRNKKVRVTGGDVDASMFPPDKLLDKNGNQLTGFAKAKRVEKLAKGSTPTTVQDTAVQDIAKDLANLTQIVSGLVQSQMSAVK